MGSERKTKKFTIKNRGQYYNVRVDKGDGTFDVVPGYSVYNTVAGSFQHGHSKVFTKEEAQRQAAELNAQHEERNQQQAYHAAKEAARLANMTEAERGLEQAEQNLKSAKYCLRLEEDGLFGDAEGMADNLEYIAKRVRETVERAREAKTQGNYLPTTSPLQLVTRLMEQERHLQQMLRYDTLMNDVQRIGDYSREVAGDEAEVARLKAVVEAEKAEAEAAEQQRIDQGMALIDRFDRFAVASIEAQPGSVRGAEFAQDVLRRANAKQ